MLEHTGSLGWCGGRRLIYVETTLAGLMALMVWLGVFVSLSNNTQELWMSLTAYYILASVRYQLAFNHFLASICVWLHPVCFTSRHSSIYVYNMCVDILELIYIKSTNLLSRWIHLRHCHNLLVLHLHTLYASHIIFLILWPLLEQQVHCLLWLETGRRY